MKPKGKKTIGASRKATLPAPAAPDLEAVREASMVGTWEWRGKRIELSPELCRMLGLPASHTKIVPGKDPFIHRADQPKLSALLHKAVKSRSTFAMEHRLVRTDGSVMLVRTHGTVTGLGKGAKEAVINATSRDITLEKQLEQELYQMASIVENSQDAVVGLNRDGVVLSWNRGAEAIYGVSADEIKSRHVSMILPPERTKEFEQRLRTILEGKSIIQEEVVHITKAGRRIDVSITVAPTYDKQGNLTGMSMISRDITHQKELQQLQKDFVSIASHELRTPITALIGFLSMVETNKQLSPEQASQFVSRASSAAARLSALVEDLLSVARLEEGRLSFNLRSADPAVILRRVVRGLGPKADSKQIKLTFTSKIPRGTKIAADSSKLEQVFVNLVDNAVKYTPEGGSVSATISATRKEVVIRVKDTGIGIQKENLDRVYDKFFREYTEMSVMAGGTGLGLFITKELVERQGGQLEIKSQPGKGTTAIVRFPRTNGKARPKPKKKKRS